MNLVVIAVLLVLTGCATHSPAPVESTGGSSQGSASVDSGSQISAEKTQPIESGSESLVLVAPKVEPEPLATRAPAVSQLLRQAQGAFERGHYYDTLAFAERGLRIQRQEPGFYYWLARGHGQLGRQDQQRSFAEQGLRYSLKGTEYFQPLSDLAEN